MDSCTSERRAPSTFVLIVDGVADGIHFIIIPVFDLLAQVHPGSGQNLGSSGVANAVDVSGVQ